MKRILTILAIAVGCLIAIPAVTAHAQTVTATSDLPSLFRKYQTNAFQEKVYVQTDKTTYLSGELIWLQVYQVDEWLNRPSANASITYIQLLGPDQRPVLQTAINMSNGIGDGSMLVPANIPTGTYTLRAYTAWMKNFNPDLFFTRRLTIINTVNNITRPDTTLPGYDVQFFPEGGNLVDGLPSTVAFKAVSSKGSGTDCSGAIIDQKGDTTARFAATRFGMGRFSFTPKAGNTYHASIRLPDTTILQKIATPFTQGYTMALTEPSPAKLKVTIHTNIATPDPSLYLFIHTRQTAKVFMTTQTSNGEASFTFDRSALGEGVSHITVFNSNRTPVTERLFFIPPSHQLNITAGTTIQSFAPRSLVQLDCATRDDTGQPLVANISMSCFLLDSLQDIPGENIIHYLWLGSELQGQIEHAQYYFEDHGADSRAAIEDLMLTQGWRRFRWEDVLQNQHPYFEFLPEINGPVISGKVIDKTTGKAVPSVTGYLSVPGKSFSFSAATSQADGTIRFNPPFFKGNSEIVVQTDPLTDSNDRIDISSPWYTASEAINSSPTAALSPGYRQQLLQRSIAVQVENSYLTRQKRQFAPLTAADTGAFYGPPDHSYKLDDYTRFVTLEEVIKEYVLDVRVRHQSGKYNYRVKNALFNVFFEDEPLLLIDGLPVFDAGKLMSLDPQKIRQIDVVNHKFYNGPVNNDGIVSYRTYDGDLGGYALDANAVAMQYSGIQQEREFYTPVYDTKDRIQSRIPDKRNVLSWQPNLTTDSLGHKNLGFYTSDISGKFAVLIEGLTKQGLAGHTILTFTVTSPNQTISQTQLLPAQPSLTKRESRD